MSLLSAFLFAISFFSAYEVAQPFTSLNKLKTKEDPCLNFQSSFWDNIVNYWLPNLCVHSTKLGNLSTALHLGLIQGSGVESVDS